MTGTAHGQAPARLLDLSMGGALVHVGTFLVGVEFVGIDPHDERILKAYLKTVQPRR